MNSTAPFPLFTEFNLSGQENRKRSIQYLYCNHLEKFLFAILVGNTKDRAESRMRSVLTKF